MINKYPEDNLCNTVAGSRLSLEASNHDCTNRRIVRFEEEIIEEDDYDDDFEQRVPYLFIFDSYE